MVPESNYVSLGPLLLWLIAMIVFPFLTWIAHQRGLRTRARMR